MSYIKIDRGISSNGIILDFIIQTNKSYKFKVDVKLVRMNFSYTDKTVEYCLARILRNLYR